MNLIKREITDSILRKVKPRKVVIIKGARRVGKTIMLLEIIKKINKHILMPDLKQ